MLNKQQDGASLRFHCLKLAIMFLRASLVVQMVTNSPAIQETWVQSLSQEDSPGGGHGDPLQYSCLENPMDRGSWWATVHEVRVRHDWVTNTHTHTHIMLSNSFLFKGGIIGCINCGSSPKYSVSLKACFCVIWTVQRDTILQTTSCLILVSLAP